MGAITAAIFGLIFGAGLAISGMTDPNRILAFLDVTGDWDPALAFVMAGAIAVALPAFAIARWAKTSALGEFDRPSGSHRADHGFAHRGRGHFRRRMGPERSLPWASHRAAQHGATQGVRFLRGSRRGDLGRGSAHVP